MGPLEDDKNELIRAISGLGSSPISLNSYMTDEGLNSLMKTKLKATIDPNDLPNNVTADEYVTEYMQSTDLSQYKAGLKKDLMSIQLNLPVINQAKNVIQSLATTVPTLIATATAAAAGTPPNPSVTLGMLQGFKSTMDQHKSSLLEAANKLVDVCDKLESVGLDTQLTQQFKTLLQVLTTLITGFNALYNTIP